MELCPSSEAPPRGLREITSVHEAPPRGLRGITSWPWGTNTIPSWNYVLMLRHHHELSLGGSMELCPLDEAPPWAPTKRVMGLRPPHTLSMFHQPIIEFPCISISCQYWCKQPNIQAYIIPSSCHTHRLPALTYHMKYIWHHNLSYLKHPSTNHVKHTHMHSTLPISLKLKSSHSSERNPSLKLPALAWARLQTKGMSRSCSS